MSMRRTLLGLDKGANAGLKRHLRDESLAAIEYRKRSQLSHGSPTRDSNFRSGLSGHHKN